VFVAALPADAPPQREGAVALDPPQRELRHAIDHVFMPALRRALDRAPRISRMPSSPSHRSPPVPRP